jgi:hypothetical protein
MERLKIKMTWRIWNWSEGQCSRIPRTPRGRPQRHWHSLPKIVDTLRWDQGSGKKLSFLRRVLLAGLSSLHMLLQLVLDATI